MRAVTPIIAVIILVLITISAAGAAFLWIQTVQNQLASENQAGLDTSLMEMHGEVALESVFNRTSQLCMIVRNSGSILYTRSLLKEMTVYVGEDPYTINTTTIPSNLGAGDRMLLCLCTPAELPNENCTGVVDQGYAYGGAKIDVTLEVPVGTGDMYTDFVSIG
jgi:flagellin-like protein